MKVILGKFQDTAVDQIRFFKRGKTFLYDIRIYARTQGKREHREIIIDLFRALFSASGTYASKNKNYG
jgi:hypothetical protein